MSSNPTSSPRESVSAVASHRASVNPGDMLAGKFRVERVVGRGGMGVVIEATNVQLDQKVALKLLATGADDPSVVERFSREARAAARLRSEHVARVYDVGKDTLHGPFIVMEMLDGQTLADVIGSVGRVQMHRAIEYIIDACEGLAEAHARGIVHQDVKPANLFLVTGADGRPSIKLLDFGIATMRTKEREVDAKSSHRSTGTPAYLAPEQLRGSVPVDHRADIWSLGCVLYELLVGERAFRATRFTELVTKILEAPPHPFPEDLGVPAPVVAAIERCLEKDPAKRFASTGELALALLPFARRRAHSAAARAVAHVKSGGLDPHLEMPSSMPPPPSDGSIDFPSSAHLRAPGVPSFSSMQSTGPSSAPPSGVVPASAPAPAAPPARRRAEGILVAGVLLLLVVGGVVLWLRAGAPAEHASDPSRAGAASLSASAGSSDAPAGSTSAVPSGVVAMRESPSPSPSPSAAPSASVAPLVQGHRVVPPPHRPVPHAPASGSGQAVRPVTTDSDIRRSR